MPVDPLNMGPLTETATKRRQDAAAAAQAARMRALEELAGRAALTADAGYAEPGARERIIGRANINDARMGAYGDAAGSWWSGMPGIASGLLVGLGDAGSAAYDKAKKDRNRGGGSRRGGGGGGGTYTDPYLASLEFELERLAKLRAMRAASGGVPRYTGKRGGGGLAKVS